MNDKNLIAQLDRARWFIMRTAGAEFYSMLTMQLSDELGDIETAMTDGRKIVWGRKFLAALSDQETRFVLMHEAMHCAHGHLWRLPANAEANQACDHAINLTLLASGMAIQMPAMGLADVKYVGMAEEEVYKLLIAQKQSQAQEQAQAQQAQQGQDEQPQPAGGQPDESPDNADAGGCGGFSEPAPDAPENEDTCESLRDQWQQVVIQAAMGEKSGRGSQSAAAQSLLERVRASRIDWKSECSEFVRSMVAMKNDWSRCNRRMAGGSVIYPRRSKDAAGLIVFARDTSGSVDLKTVAAFNDLIECCLSEVGSDGLVIDCDSQVNAECKIAAGEQAPERAIGGGGTKFAPVFERVCELMEQGEQVAGIVYLTDGQGSFPDAALYARTAVPTLWAMTTSEVAPVGRTVRAA